MDGWAKGSIVPPIMSRDAHTRAEHSHTVQGGSRVGSNNQFTSVQVLTVGMTYRDIVITGLQAMP